MKDPPPKRRMRRPRDAPVNGNLDNARQTRI
jgi:hypothetical protein